LPRLRVHLRRDRLGRDHRDDAACGHVDRSSASSSGVRARRSSRSSMLTSIRAGACRTAWSAFAPFATGAW